jgi:hypothetical protein
MLAVHNDASSSKFKMIYSFKQLKWGRKSIEVDPCPGEQLEMTVPGMGHNLNAWSNWTDV